MVQYNYFSSCLLFIAVLCSNVSHSFGAEGGVDEIIQTLQTEDIDVWDMDYDIRSTDISPVVDLNRFWTKVFVTIHDGFRKVKVAAALSKEGLYVYPGFAYKLPSQGKLELGLNHFEYSMQVPSLDAPKCPSSAAASLMLKGIAGEYIPEEDTWLKEQYNCHSRSDCEPSTICDVNIESTEAFICHISITNRTDMSVMPIWNSKRCYFTPPCILNGYFARLLDASALEKCYEGSFTDEKLCVTAPPIPVPTPTPTSAPTPSLAPTRAPTDYVPDCGVPQDAAEFPEYSETIKGLGYVTSNNILGRGVQYHLVPSNPSSCPITSYNMFDEKEAIFNFPQGCDGHLYATLFKNLRCGDAVKFKFKYQQNGSKILHMTYDGLPFTQ